MKRSTLTKLFSSLLAAMLVLATIAASPAPQPHVTFALLSGLPDTMQIGESHTVVILVTSDTTFNIALALPGMYYPGRYVVANRGDHALNNTTATLRVTFVAKGSTANLPGGVAPVSVTAGARFKNGITVSQRFDFTVAVP